MSKTALFFPGQASQYVGMAKDLYDESAEVRRLLEEQRVSPVLWSRTMENMMQNGISEFIEIGSGSVLSGLIRKINRQANVVNVDSLAGLDAF